MSKQFEQLEILYKQVLTLTNDIKKLIEKEDFDEAVLKEESKAQIVAKISLVNKTVKLSDEENDIINSLKKSILTNEKENLSNIKDLRDKTLIELKSLNSKSKISDKYEQIETEEGTICDYTSD